LAMLQVNPLQLFSFLQPNSKYFFTSSIPPNSQIQTLKCYIYIYIYIYIWEGIYSHNLSHNI
ncbi:MAG: hypothetical protein MCS20_01080, partial [Candidatus Phytoplasma mali]|nr:hypothetical protein [Candidatus Phytoplasma australiense]MBZ7920040.1 hypothetical protein [Candidatus Karelsulcia muelleri]MCG7201993.1 hypothetical protein [Candidatus Phytoplasma mali]MCZ8632003.1 hypothetical protein [Spiroplasma sp. Tabriz.8]